MQTIHLQYHGQQKAKKASEFQIGDYIMYNYGHTSQVIGIIKKTDKTLTFVVLSDGVEYTRNYRNERLIAFK